MRCTCTLELFDFGIALQPVMTRLAHSLLLNRRYFLEIILAADSIVRRSYNNDQSALFASYVQYTRILYSI